MSLSGGSVTVADDGTYSGSGLALARFEAQLANEPGVFGPTEAEAAANWG